MNHAALLHQVRAALALVSRERAILARQAQELHQEFQLIGEYSSKLSEARSTIAERLNGIIVTEGKLRVAEERLQQLVLAPPPGPKPDDLVLNQPETRSPALLMGGDGQRIPSGKWPRISPLRMALIVVTVCSVALVVLLSGAVGDVSSTMIDGVPVIERVTLDPTQPLPGEPVTVRWDVENADRIAIQPLLSNLDVDLGEYTFPGGFDQDTTLTIVAANEQGRAEKPVMIVLGNYIHTPTPTQTSSAAGALDSSPVTATASMAADPSQEPTPSSDLQITSVTPTPSPLWTDLPEAISSQEPAAPLQTYTPTAPEPTPTPEPPSPMPTATPVEVDASPTPAAPTTTDVSSCSPAGTLPSGSYCDERGLFTVWVYACETLEMRVDWGDGAIEGYEGLQIGESVSHQYSVPGTYGVLVTSTFDAASCQHAELAVTYAFQYPSSS